MSSGRAPEPSIEMARERHNSSIRSRKGAMRKGKKHSAGKTNLLKKFSCDRLFHIAV